VPEREEDTSASRRAGEPSGEEQETPVVEPPDEEAEPTDEEDASPEPER
jgi:hypothetical protein